MTHHSLIVAYQNTILKVDPLFNFDTAFNGVGRILFDISQTDLIPAGHTLTTNSVNFSGLFFNNSNNLFVIGNFFVTSSIYSTISFILCYDISDLVMPHLNTDFFSKGHPVPPVQQKDNRGIQQLVITQDLISSMLLFGTSWGISVPLESQFNRKNIIFRLLINRLNAATDSEKYPLLMD